VGGVVYGLALDAPRVSLLNYGILPVTCNADGSDWVMLCWCVTAISGMTHLGLWHDVLCLSSDNMFSSRVIAYNLGLCCRLASRVFLHALRCHCSRLTRGLAQQRPLQDMHMSGTYVWCVAL
jgi:hypothetical protein